MGYPKELRLLDILRWASQPPHQTQQSTTDENGWECWIPARDLPYEPGGLAALRHRLRCAWMVFTGRADVLHWR